ncbi:peptidoglycan DD-metalloendopeptidase family protein [Flavobacteriaceae bacterium TK19130]|nr:peptidoglycan DD-metalloendopeptidase family protein [Thermobacterium salinum]
MRTLLRKHLEPWAEKHRVSLKVMFPTLSFDSIASPDMSAGSDFFEGSDNHEDLETAGARIDAFQKEHPTALLANGYLQQRSFYDTPNYQLITPQGIEYRNVHLGTDFWIPARTPLHSPFDGEVVICSDIEKHKDYGPLLILKHSFANLQFYTLHGHLSKDSLTLSPKGKKVKQGEKIGYIGDETENGHWVPHLHFQVITDLMGNTFNFNGTAFRSELEVWKNICPDPAILFEEEF